MQAISSDVLKGATEQITKLAAEARRADHAARRRASSACAPPRSRRRSRRSPSTSSGSAAQVEQLERTGRDPCDVRQLFESTATELGKLRMETGALVSALKRPQVRGSWGEIQLKNVVRIAGMTDHVDFHDAGDDPHRRRRRACART